MARRELRVSLIDKDPAETLHNALITFELCTLDPTVRCLAELMSDMLAESFTEVGKSGKVYSRDDVLSRLSGEPGGATEVDELKVYELGEKFALVAYRGIKAENSPSSSGVTRRASTWSREADRWRLMFHKGTSIRVDGQDAQELK